MKTAMKELIDWMKTEDFKDAMSGINMAENLLDREREQMRHAFLCGDDAVFQFNRAEDYKSFDEYFNETYKP